MSAVFERLLQCYFAVPVSLTGKFRKKHTHTRLFFFEKSWANFFLKPFVFAIQFLDRSWILFLRKKFVEFYFSKTNSAKIYIFLNIYSVKIYSFKVIQRSKLRRYLGKRFQCILFFKCLGAPD